MTGFQKYALQHPLAVAGGSAQKFWREVEPWSIILTVNK